MTTIRTTRILRQWLSRLFPFAATTLVETPVTTVVQPLHRNQLVEKHFVLTTRNPTNPLSRINRLRVCAPGLTIVRVRPELLKDIGPDGIARIRVSSDEPEYLNRLGVVHENTDELTVQYTARKGSMGHLVTEIELPHEAQLERVIAAGNCDVVVMEDIPLPPATTENQSSVHQTMAFGAVGLISQHGARLFLSGVDRALFFDDLTLTCVGRGHVHVAAHKIKNYNELFCGTFGRGTISIHTQSLVSTDLDASPLGSGSIELTTDKSFDIRNVFISQSGQGSVRFATTSETDVALCARQDVNIGGGRVDIADIPSEKTEIMFMFSASGTLRMQSPREKLCFYGGRKEGRAHVHHIGSFPPIVKRQSTSVPADTVFKEITVSDLERLRQNDMKRITIIPTMYDAFDKPTKLDKSSTEWLVGVVMETLYGFLPRNHATK